LNKNILKENYYTNNKKKLMEYKTIEEKIEIVSNIIRKLKYHIGTTGEIVDLYKQEYSYYETIKNDFNNYIRNNETISNKILFEEIGCKIEYNLPCKKRHKPFFVIRKRN
jgi:hypothetical protein